MTMTRKTATMEVTMTRKAATPTMKMMTRNEHRHVFLKYCRSGVPVSEYDPKKALPEHHDELGELCSPMLAVSAWPSMTLCSDDRRLVGQSRCPKCCDLSLIYGRGVVRRR